MRVAAFALFLFVTAVAASDAQALSWGPRTAPDSLTDHTMIYDPPRDRLVVFGGRSGSTFSNKTWVYSFSGCEGWQALQTFGVPPDARRDHTAIYDPVADRMLIFGGDTGVQKNDVWQLSLGPAPTWTQLNPSGAVTYDLGTAKTS